MKKTEMKISNIQIVPIQPKNGIVAFASLLLDDALYISSIAIMTRPKGGFRLVYPTKKTPKKDISIFYPVNRPFGQQIEKDVINEFQKVIKLDDRYHYFNIAS